MVKRGRAEACNFHAQFLDEAAKINQSRRNCPGSRPLRWHAATSGSSPLHPSARLFDFAVMWTFILGHLRMPKTVGGMGLLRHSGLQWPWPSQAAMYVTDRTLRATSLRKSSPRRLDVQLVGACCDLSISMLCCCRADACKDTCNGFQWSLDYDMDLALDTRAYYAVTLQRRVMNT